jgi:hypothetical protein
MRTTARLLLTAPLAASLAVCLSCSSVSLPNIRAWTVEGPARPLQSAPAETAKSPAAGGGDAIGAGPGADAFSSLQATLLEGTRQVLGQTRLEINGKSFPYDCSGTVRAIYWFAGIDLARRFARYGGNGVNRLYRTLEDLQLLYDTTRPVPGDLIFWDNTYDRNGDGEWNDPLTHAGMVVRTAEDGGIEYVHLNYHKGIVIEFINLLDSDTHQVKAGGTVRIVNSPMRLGAAGRSQPGRWLASHLYRKFGMAYRVSF